MKAKQKIKPKLAGFINSLAGMPWDQRRAAKYGAHVPSRLFEVEYWQGRRPQLAKDFTMAPHEKEAMLSFFMWPFMGLNDKFFMEIAEAIQFYKKNHRKTEDALRYKLSDPNFIFKDATSTAKEIAKRVGIDSEDEDSMNTLRRVLRKMKRQYRQEKGGRKKGTKNSGK